MVPCWLPDIDCSWADKMIRSASATVFPLSCATKGLTSGVDWSESCCQVQVRSTKLR